MSFTHDAKPLLPTPLDKPNPFEFNSPANRPLDLDGMNIMTRISGPTSQTSDLEMNMDLGPLSESPEDDADEIEELPWGNAPATASWAPLMEEVDCVLPLHLQLTLTRYRSSAQTGAVHHL